MKAVLQSGSCWLVVANNQCTVLRVAPNTDACLFPGEVDEQPLECVQEWLAPVWTPTMLKCSRCLKQVAERLQPDHCCSVRETFPSVTEPPHPQSFWIAAVHGHPDVLQVVENGFRVPGRHGTHPLEQVRVWIMPVWSPEMAYCASCAQAKPKRDMVFLFTGSPKGVCKGCSEDFDFQTSR